MPITKIRIGLNTRISREQPITLKSLQNGYPFLLATYIKSHNRDEFGEKFISTMQKYLHFLQNVDHIELTDQFTFADIIIRGLAYASKRLDSYIISAIVELLRLKVLPTDQILDVFKDNEQAYNVASCVINDDYSSLKLENLQYIPHKYLMKLQEVTSIPEIQYLIARHF